MTQKNEEQWFERFKDTLENEEGSSFFNNTGRDLERVQAADEKTVWSVIEGEGDNLYLLPGFHVVNNIGYVLSEEPITDAELASGEWDEVLWVDGNDLTPNI